MVKALGHSKREHDGDDAFCGWCFSVASGLLYLSRLGASSRGLNSSDISGYAIQQHL